jgi:hypothetical protein
MGELLLFFVMLLLAFSVVGAGWIHFAGDEPRWRDRDDKTDSKSG